MVNLVLDSIKNALPPVQFFKLMKKSTEIKDIEEIAQQAHLGEDVSEHFTGNFQVKQQINIDFPLELLRSIDAECQVQKMNRQDWIEMVCGEKICEVKASRASNPV